MHKEAQWKVRIACETGVGADRFLDGAVHYYRLAACNGHEQAQVKASDYYVQEKGISRDRHTNIQILEAGAGHGDTRAKRLLRRAKLRLLLRRLRPFKTRSTPLALDKTWKWHWYDLSFVAGFRSKGQPSTVFRHELYLLIARQLQLLTRDVR